jgi:ABC-type phosphate transport system ATPase subunit
VGIKVTKTPKWGKYKKRLKKTDDALYSVAEAIIVGIINRTQSGKDKNKKGFKAYSKSYGKSGTVNLTEKGTMLHSIDRKKIKNGIKLFFSNTNENAKAHGNQVKYGRKFFGIDKKQKELIKRRLGKYIVKTRG